MIGIVIPAHNEEDSIGACVAAARTAATAPELGGEPVRIVVVLDDCSDATGAIAHEWGADVVAVHARNVGAARAAGARACLLEGARWLAFTDADTRVSPGWLAAQLAHASDVVCGTVAVDDWSPHGEQIRALHAARYRDAAGHRHIHGANLGISAQAYGRAGGFQALASSEDVAMVRALEAIGARIAWSAAPRVFTSARHDHRAPDGFGATLLRMAAV